MPGGLQRDELLTSFLVRTAASWVNCLMASFVFSSSSAFCFSLNKAWRGRQRQRVSERGNNCWKTRGRITEKSDGREQKKAIRSDGPDPSAAPPLRPPGRSPWLWPAPRTSPPPRRCSAPAALPPFSPTPFAPCEPSPPPGTRFSVWQRRERNWQPGADGKIITLFSPLSRGETCDCAVAECVLIVFCFFYFVPKDSVGTSGWESCEWSRQSGWNIW